LSHSYNYDGENKEKEHGDVPPPKGAADRDNIFAQRNCLTYKTTSIARMMDGMKNRRSLFFLEKLGVPTEMRGRKFGRRGGQL